MGPTFADIARRAGVGTATVERVLNGRGGVRPATVEKVVAAARALDWPRRLPEVHRGLLRVEVILVRPETTFYRRLSRAFERIAATLDPAVSVFRTFMDETDARAIAARIAATEPRRAGLILSVPDDPAIRAAVARRRPGYAGGPRGDAGGRRGRPRQHRQLRRRAHGGDFLSRMQPASGRVMAICHPIYQVHRERMRGFSDYFHGAAARGPRLRLGGFGRDEARRCGDLLHRGAGDVAGPGRALQRRGGQRGGRRRAAPAPARAAVFFVGHELTDDTAASLRDGTMAVVLDQAPEAQARRAIDLMLSSIGLLDVALDTAPIRFVTVTAESL